MLRYPCSKFFFRLLTAAPRHKLSLHNLSFRYTITTTTSHRQPALRPPTTLDPKSLMEDTESELFNYTTGRFLANEALHLKERRRVFNIPGLFKIIANALSRNPEEIVDFRKLGEGGFNRAFLVTFHTGLRLIARIPYPLLAARTYTLASEVATMDFLHSKGLPVPKTFGYSFVSDNEAQTEYILMEYIEGTDLSKIWFDLQEDEIVSLMDQLAHFESTTMSIPFPAGGGIYYTEDLKSISGDSGIPFEGPFCIGPDVSTQLWFGRREKLDIFRGPYKDAKLVMVTGAKKELAYLDRFGSPRAPYQHMHREHYDYKKQSPSDHAENLQRYLRLAPWLVPDDTFQTSFCIRHPDLRSGNIMVSSNSDGLRILSVLDWQNSAVLPLFLQGGMPDFIQNEEDQVSRSMVKPELPSTFDQLSPDDQEWQKELFRRRLVHYNYVLSTAAYNKFNHKAFVYTENEFRRRIFKEAIIMWPGETFKLQYALIQMVRTWDLFSKGDDEPCPVEITEDEEAAAGKLYEALTGAEETEKMFKNVVGCGEETWVPVDEYETAKEMGQRLKRMALESSRQEGKEDVCAAIEANWPLDDMTKEDWKDYK